MNPLSDHQDAVLQVLKNKAQSFYLAGGTALAKFYFQHRDSYDLDFFSQDWSAKELKDIVRHIALSMKKEMKLVRESSKEGFARLSIYNLMLGKQMTLKIDFVEDFIPLLSPLRNVDGLQVLSLEDIYLRKIHAIAGTMPVADITGRNRFLGGRQEAKDFFDMYYLSTTHNRLSLFALENCNDLQKEALIRRYHAYNRQEIKLGLMELKTANPIDFAPMERYFKNEIDALIKGML